MSVCWCMTWDKRDITSLLSRFYYDTQDARDCIVKSEPPRSRCARATTTRLLARSISQSDPERGRKNGTPSNVATAQVSETERRISFYYPITINGREQRLPQSGSNIKRATDQLIDCVYCRDSKRIEHSRFNMKSTRKSIGVADRKLNVPYLEQEYRT